MLSMLMAFAVVGGGLAGMTATQSAGALPTAGYWLVSADGGTFAFGAPFLGNPISSGPDICSAPVTVGSQVCRAIAASPGGDGYWVMASETFEGGTSGMVSGFGAIPLTPTPPPLSGLNGPLVGAATTSNGSGLLLAASDGGVFAYGTASFFGSAAGEQGAAPIVGISTSSVVNGYWLAAADGKVQPFGAAIFFEDMSTTHLNAPIVGIAATSDGRGYWLTAADGGVFAFGDASFAGSMAGHHLNAPVVGLAASEPAA